MSDESKTAEGDYVHMDGGKGHTPGSLKNSLSLDDPNLSQVRMLFFNVEG